MCTSNEIYNCEILAPAGTYETMLAAFNAGADAVYVGGSMFGARAFAGNFDQDELIAAINYAHFIGKKLYLTVNTLLKDEEIDAKLYEYLKPYYEVGLDAVIVQDLGLIKYISDRFPKLPIHCSTQMTITGKNFASIFAGTNVTRIVTPRELNLNEIKEIYDSCGLEIESFVHGALCYCYSGQCLLSSMIGGRSGNRGRCAQPCRLPYSIKELGIKEKYLLSPKDLCTLDILPDIIEAKVFSLKIEGRMKKPEYVASVVSIYRKYVDLLKKYGKSAYKVDKNDIEYLKEIYNRGGFTDGYYNKHNDKSIMSIDRPNHSGVCIGKVLSVNKNSITIRVSKDIIKGDILEVSNNEFYAPYDVNAGSSFEYKCVFKGIKNGDEIIRTRNEKIINTTLNKYLLNEKGEKRCLDIDVSIHVYAHIGENIVVTVSNNECSVDYIGPIAETALKKPLSALDIVKQMSKLGGSGFSSLSITVDILGDIFVPVSVLNELRRESLSLFKESLLSKYRRAIFENVNSANDEIFANTLNDSCIIADNNIINKTDYTILITNKDQFEIVVEYVNKGLCISRLYVEYAMFSIDELKNMCILCCQNGINMYLAMPYITRSSTINAIENDMKDIEVLDIKGFMFRNMETYIFFKNSGANLRKVIFDANIYTFNKYDANYLKGIGADVITASYELNSNELKSLASKDMEMVIYGYIPVMYSAGCIHKTLNNCKKYDFVNKKNANNEKKPGKLSENDLIDIGSVIELEDRKRNRFKIMNVCRYCYNVMYNCVPMALINNKKQLDDLGIGAYRICFTLEDKEMVHNILNGLLENDYVLFTEGEYTKGHFKRGVD